MRSFGCSLQSDGQGEDHSEQTGPDGQGLLYQFWSVELLGCEDRGVSESCPLPLRWVADIDRAHSKGDDACSALLCPAIPRLPQCGAQGTGQ